MCVRECVYVAVGILLLLHFNGKLYRTCFIALIIHAPS